MFSESLFDLMKYFKDISKLYRPKRQTKTLQVKKKKQIWLKYFVFQIFLSETGVIISSTPNSTLNTNRFQRIFKESFPPQFTKKTLLNSCASWEF